MRLFCGGFAWTPRPAPLHYESRGAFVVKLHGSAYQRAGLPDLLVLTRDGMTRWIEVKRPGRKLTRIQERVIESICKCGGLVFVSHGKPPF